jgi:hypothetical protein
MGRRIIVGISLLYLLDRTFAPVNAKKHQRTLQHVPQEPE